MDKKFASFQSPPKDKTDSITAEEHKLFSFLGENADGWGNKTDWEIDSCVLIQLPIEEQLRALNAFVTHGETLFQIVDDFTKLVYHKWNEYDMPYADRPRVYPHNQFYELLYTLRTQLRWLANMKEKKFDLKKRTQYVHWHICGCYPLLGEKGVEMLKTVCQMRYDDAQDMMMMGMYQLDPNVYINDVLDIWEYWETHGNIQLLDSGTGALWQFHCILDKYKRMQFKFPARLRLFLERLVESSGHRTAYDINAYLK